MKKLAHSIPTIPFMLLCLGLISSGCRPEKKQKTLFQLVEDSGIEFENRVIDSKDDNSFLFRNFYNGGGVGIGDINNDGLADVILTSNMEANRIFLNNGNFRFEDITARSGIVFDGMWSTGVSLVDINDDGWLDIYICSSGNIKSGKRRNKLYINNRDLSFTESAASYGLDHSGFSTQASFFDYDNDGDLDCFLINNSPLPFSSLNHAAMRDTDIRNWNVSEDLKGGGNHLYRNDNKYFTEVTKEAGLHTGLISFGLGVSIGDVNSDLLPDIFVGNDFIERDYLYINQGDGTFVDELEQRIQQISMSSMSADLADINNDGLPEILTTDMIPEDDYRLKTTGTFDNIDLYHSKLRAGLYHQFVRNALQLNNGDGTFSEIANIAGVAATDWSWGAVFLDADNDGWNDIFICNGINRDLGNLDFLDFFSNEVYREMLATGKKQEINEILAKIPVTPLPNRVYRNKGDLRFSETAKDWGLDQPGFSNSIAYGDLDNDGDLDVVINNENQPAFVYRNQSDAIGSNHYVSLRLEGSPGNRFALGAKVSVFKNKEIITRELSPARGFQSSMDYRLVIGLGTDPVIDSIVVTWPDHTKSILPSPEVDTLLVVKKHKADLKIKAQENPLAGWLRKMDVPLQRHVENDHVDFYFERNLPAGLSKEGPGIAVADVNGDGLEDFFIGGASGQPGMIYLAKGSTYSPVLPSPFMAYADFEDVAAFFFDADGDKDADLFIGAGGNQAQPGSRTLQHRLFRNDGRGNFTIDTKAFPINDINISTAAAADFDSDGDMDLFVGGRSIPLHYGLTPASYIYTNDGSGKFSDVTPQVCPELQNLGLVTSATWSDVNGDGLKELLIVGEWMDPVILRYDAGRKKFIRMTGTGLEGLFGWWQTIKAGDLDGDGREDLVLGNIGENFYLAPVKKSPVKLWLDDFDGDGSIESFLTKTVAGRDVPVFLKREVTDQFPSLKKNNLRHSDYATRSIQDLFGNERMRLAKQRIFNYCTSIIALNRGNGRFTVRPLPVRAQLSSVSAVELVDVNKDGLVDMLTGGNRFDFPPQFGRLDASYGNVFMNKGSAEFEWIEPLHSGLSLSGCTRDIKTVRNSGNIRVVFARNDEYPVIFSIK